MSEPDSFAFMDAFCELGGNFIDTALNYADWSSEVKSASEKTIGKWLSARKLHHKVIVGTKGACPRTGGPFFRLKREDILSDLEESLRNLQTDWIDLYWLHRDDPSIPVENIIDVLEEQVQAGKIRYYGCSNWTLARIRQAQAYAATKGKSGFVANQMMWSLAEPNTDAVSDKTLVLMDEETRAYHNKTGMASIPFSSQAGGFFSGQYRRGEPPARKPGLIKLYGNDTNFDRLERVQEVARRRGATSNQIALAFLLSQPHAVFPIIGSRTLEQLEDSCAVGDLKLDPETVKYIEFGAKEISNERG
jgi:aryl-alcohol dehydrogenase-like predicted oxidoreductase